MNRNSRSSDDNLIMRAAVACVNLSGIAVGEEEEEADGEIVEHGGRGICERAWLPLYLARQRESVRA